MKKIIVFILCIIFCSFTIQSQNAKDTLSKQGKVIEKRIIVTTDESDDDNIMIDANCPMGHHNGMSEPCCLNSKKTMMFMKNHKPLKNCISCQIKHLSYSAKTLVLMPVILFFFVFIIFFFWLRRENFKLSDALSSRSPVEIIKTTNTRTDPSDHTKIIIETNEEAFYPRSTSRLIAFITGITAIIIAICAITYFAYFSIKLCTPPPHFGGLWVIIFLLSIGVIPYTVRTMFKK